MYRERLSLLQKRSTRLRSRKESMSCGMAPLRKRAERFTAAAYAIKPCKTLLLR